MTVRLERLYLRGVRNLAPVQIGPVRGLNVISGRNGAGKTALLEGIHLALHGRSFRDRDLCNVIGAKEACVEAAAWLCDGLPSGANRRHAVVRRERAASRTVFAVDGNGVPRLDGCGLPMSIPVTQEEIRAIRVSAERRRALVDVFLFHVNPDYAAAWRRYRSALRQRNAALRASAPCGPWEGAMSDAAQSLHDYRESHVKSIAEQLPGALEALGLDVPCEVVYRPGCRDGDKYLRACVVQGLRRTGGMVIIEFRAQVVGQKHDVVSAQRGRLAQPQGDVRQLELTGGRRHRPSRAGDPESHICAVRSCLRVPRRLVTVPGGAQDLHQRQLHHRCTDPIRQFILLKLTPQAHS